MAQLMSHAPPADLAVTGCWLQECKLWQMLFQKGIVVQQAALQTKSLFCGHAGHARCS